MTTSTSRKTSTPPAQSAHERFGLYAWTAIVLAVAVGVVIVSWHATGGTTDPTDLPAGHRLSHTTVVLDSAVLVFREGLETILVLAAITASFCGANGLPPPRRARAARWLPRHRATWFGVIWWSGSSRPLSRPSRPPPGSRRSSSCCS